MYKGNWNDMLADLKKTYEDELAKPRDEQDKKFLRERRRNIIACKWI
jgi:hypothetical protein